MSPTARKIAAVVASLAVIAIMVEGAMRLSERQQTAEEINRLRDDLFRARVAADRCQGSLQNSEASLRELGATIEAMKAQVDSFEAMDSRGVPANEYPEYIELFDSYNDSVAVWEVREQRLRTAEASCRATIEEHNAVTDTLQAVLDRAGIDAS